MSDGASSISGTTGRGPSASASGAKSPAAPFTPDFGDVQLTLAEARELQHRAHRLVQEIIAEYTSFIETSNRRVDPKIWKSVKSKESFAVYRDRRNAVDRAYGSQSEVIRPDDYSMPPLLGVGAIVGAVEDIMYGLATYKGTDMQWKSAQQQGEELNGKLLAELQTPSLDDPFRSLGVRWSLMGHNSLTSVVLHDLVILVGTGTEMMPDGTTIGFQLTHSIQLPECPEFTENNILRSKISCCSLFRQQPHGNVEVFTKTFIEPSPNVPYSFALASTVASMVDVVKTVEAGKDRKLARMLKDAKQRIADGAERPVLAKDASGNNCCGLCRKCFHMYNTIVTCQLCYSMVCSRCHVSRQVRLADAEGNLSKKKVALCKNCVATIAKADASKIALKDFMNRESTKRRSVDSRHSLSDKGMSGYLEGTISSTSTSSDPRLLMGTEPIGNGNPFLTYAHNSSSSPYAPDPRMAPSTSSTGSARGLPVGVPIEDLDDVDDSYVLPPSFDVKLPKQQPRQHAGNNASPSYPPGPGVVYDPQPQYGGARVSAPAARSQSQTYASKATYAARDGYSHSDNYPSNGRGYPQTAPMAAQPQPGTCLVPPAAYGNDFGAVNGANGAPGYASRHTQPQIQQPIPMQMPMQQRTTPSPMPVAAAPMAQSTNNHQEEIWMRMNKLRLAAEDAYNMARENGDAMQMGARRFGNTVKE